MKNSDYYYVHNSLSKGEWKELKQNKNPKMSFIMTICSKRTIKVICQKIGILECHL